MKTFQIKALLLLNGYTPNSLAKELNVTGMAIRRVISHTLISPKIMARIAEITGIAPQILFPEAATRFDSDTESNHAAPGQSMSKSDEVSPLAPG
jgi:plasmid maintenance system antidote protein VapI